MRSNLILKILFACLGIGIVVFLIIDLGKINPNTICISSTYANDTIQRTYGEQLDLSGLTIEYETKAHKSKSKVVNIDMVEGYDAEYIGSQSIKIEFNGYTKDTGSFYLPKTIAVFDVLFLV